MDRLSGRSRGIGFYSHSFQSPALLQKVRNMKTYAFLLSIVGGLVAAVTVSETIESESVSIHLAGANPVRSIPVSTKANDSEPKQDEPGVIPVSEDPPKSNPADSGQLARIEGKIDKLLSGQKTITTNQDSIRIEVMEAAENDKTNTDRIVEAILSLKSNAIEPEPAKPAAAATADKSSKIVYPSKSTTRIVIRSKTSPRWNLNGSLGDAYNRSKMVNHLATASSHRRIQAVFSRSQLNTLSIGQLWTLHDDDHEGRTITRARFFQSDVIPVDPDPILSPSPGGDNGGGGDYFDPCPSGACPDSTRFRLFQRSGPVFPNAIWNWRRR